jgi:hypothetical protein
MAKPAPLDQIDRLLGAKKRFEYPSGIALKGLHHFMLIKELKWKSPEKNSDAFNGAQSGQSNFENITSGNESKDYYEEGKNFILHLPPGSLKTQYSADYADVNLGIFGDILSQNAFQIAEDLKRHFSSFGKGDTGFIQDTMDVYANMGKSMVDRAKPYYDSGDFRGDFAKRMKFNVATAVGALAPSNAKGEQIASMSMRAARNPYTSLIFTGIKKLRQHNFNFEFNPKTANESKTLMSIILNLKYGMLPGLDELNVGKKNSVHHLPVQTLTRQPHVDPLKTDIKTITIKNKMNSAFFAFPSNYRIQFFSNAKENSYLYRIGNSFLVSLKAKYSPRFFEENGMPQSIGLQLQFKENFTHDRSHAETY